LVMPVARISHLVPLSTTLRLSKVQESRHMKREENARVTAANQRQSVCGELQCVNPNTIKPKQVMTVRWLRLKMGRRLLQKVFYQLEWTVAARLRDSPTAHRAERHDVTMDSPEQARQDWLHGRVPILQFSPNSTIYGDVKFLSPHNRDVGLHIFKTGEAC
jgi:hypothetical protein